MKHVTRTNSSAVFSLIMYQKKINDTAHSFQSHIVNPEISNYSAVLILCPNCSTFHSSKLTCCNQGISMLGSKLSWSVYHCACTCISSITVLPFSLSVCSCVLLCDTKYVFQCTLTTNTKSRRKCISIDTIVEAMKSLDKGEAIKKSGFGTSNRRSAC
jgi:hypothetical protein